MTNKILVPNEGRIALAMAAAYALPNFQMIAALRDLSAQVKASPQPHRKTNAANIRRCSAKRRSVLRAKRLKHYVGKS